MNKPLPAEVEKEVPKLQSQRWLLRTGTAIEEELHDLFTYEPDCVQVWAGSVGFRWQSVRWGPWGPLALHSPQSPLCPLGSTPQGQVRDHQGAKRKRTIFADCHCQCGE